MGCKPSKASDQVTNASTHTLNKKQSDLSKNETTGALVSKPMLDESNPIQCNKPQEDIITNNAVADLIPEKLKEHLTANKAEEDLTANKAEEDQVPDKTEEASTNGNVIDEEIALDKAIEKEEIEGNREEENVVDEAVDKEEIEENEEVNVVDNAIEKDQKELEEVNEEADKAIEQEENDEKEGNEEVVIEANEISSVVDSPNSFASIKDDEVVEVTKFIEGLEVVEEEGVEMEGEVKRVEGEEGNSINKN